MPKSCCVPHCRSRYSNSNKELTFHRFPFSKPDLLKEWIGQIRSASFHPKRHTVICSTHFKPECFSKFGNRKNLLDKAVPTVFTAIGKVQQARKPKKRRKIGDPEVQEEKDVLMNSPETTFSMKTDLETTQVTEKVAEVSRSFFSKPGDPHPVQVIDHSYAIKNSTILKKKLLFALDDNAKLRKRVKIKTLQLRRMNKNVQLLEEELRKLKGEQIEEIIKVVID